MKVYVAAPWPLREAARTLAEALSAHEGILVTSRWVSVECENAAGAQMDLEDVDEANTLVLYNPPEWVNAGGGGRHTEFGYALAKGKRLIVYGKISNVFHELPQVITCLTYDTLLQTLNRMAAE